MWHLAKCLAAAALLGAVHWVGRENGRSDQAREDEHTENVLRDEVQRTAGELLYVQTELRKAKADEAHEAQETAEFSLEALHQAVRDYRNGRGSLEEISDLLPKPDADKGGTA